MAQCAAFKGKVAPVLRGAGAGGAGEAADDGWAVGVGAARGEASSEVAVAIDAAAAARREGAAERAKGVGGKGVAGWGTCRGQGGVRGGAR